MNRANSLTRADPDFIRDLEVLASKYGLTMDGDMPPLVADNTITPEALDMVAVCFIKKGGVANGRAEIHAERT